MSLVCELLRQKNEAHAAKLQNLNSTQLHNKWKTQLTCLEKSSAYADWWSEKERQIQGFADSNETQKIYEAIKAVYGPTIHAVKSKDGNTMIEDRQQYHDGQNT